MRRFVGSGGEPAWMSNGPARPPSASPRPNHKYAIYDVQATDSLILSWILRRLQLEWLHGQVVAQLAVGHHVGCL